jgi:hypothetical protein
VTSADLSKEQIHRLKAQATRHLRYFNRLVDRMTRVGFPPSDSLWIGAVQARNALHALSVELHYLTCDSGVGRDGVTRRGL